MTRVQEKSPLLPQVKQILLGKGYVPAPGMSGVYQRTNGFALSGHFMQVTSDRVIPMFVKPGDKGQSHADFVLCHTNPFYKSLFPKAR